ncbi:MAG TPA: class I tRNA ligase family protein, partial [Vicinamibacteria bacterium]|nr:class I tRNA ligase family protein [Vicinamibacteria bacterium]
MPQLRLTNTLGGKLEAFEPLDDLHVRMYTCGLTVYNRGHIGNFRTFVSQDVLRRYLKYKGYRVTQVTNFTDVDDKTIDGARAAGMDLREYTQEFIDYFFEDCATLNIERAEHYPRATDPEYIDAMVELV